MPLTSNLQAPCSFHPNTEDATWGGYPEAIARGIALGLKDLGEIIMDGVIYPAFDATVICAHLTHLELKQTEAAIRNNPKLYTELVDRMESRLESAELIYELPLFAFDAGIICAQQAGSHPDFLELNAILETNPSLYPASLFRMQQRLQPIEGAFEQFIEAPGAEKAAILAELSTVFFGPGILLKGLKIVGTTVKTYREFGAPRVAKFHPLIKNDISPTPLKFDLLSVEDIRAIPGGNSYIWVYSKDKKLKIATRDLRPDPTKESGSGHFLRHHELANADWFYETLKDQKITRQILRQLEKEGWVYGAGEAHFHYGNLELLTIRSGHFKPRDTLFSPKLGPWVEQIFNEHGFSDAPGKFKPLALSAFEEEYCHPKVSYASYSIDRQQKIGAGIVGSAFAGKVLPDMTATSGDSSKAQDIGGFASKFREQFFSEAGIKHETASTPQYLGRSTQVERTVANVSYVSHMFEKAQTNSSDFFSSDRWLTRLQSRYSEQSNPYTRQIDSLRDSARYLESIKVETPCTSKIDGIAYTAACETNAPSYLQSQPQWQSPAKAGYVKNEGHRFFSDRFPAPRTPNIHAPSVTPHVHQVDASFFSGHQSKTNQIDTQFQSLTASLLYAAKGYHGK